MASRATTKEKTTSTAERKGAPQERAIAHAAMTWRKGGEITGLLLLALSVTLCLALLSSNPADIETNGQVGNWIGPLGAYAADILLYIFGVGAFVVVAVIFLLGGFMLLGRRPDLKPSEFVGQGLFVLSGAILSHLIFNGQQLFGHPAGGLVGELLGGFSTAVIGDVGSYVFSTCGILLALMLVTDMSLGSIMSWCGRLMAGKTSAVAQRVQESRELRRRWKEEQAALKAELGQGGEGGWFSGGDSEAASARIEEKLAARRAREVKKIARPQEKAKEAEGDRGAPERASAVEAPTVRSKGPKVDAAAKPNAAAKTDAAKTDAAAKTEGFELGDTLGAIEARPEPAVVFGALVGAGEPAVAPGAKDALIPVTRGLTPATPRAVEGEGPQIVETEAQRQAQDRQRRLLADEGPVKMNKQVAGGFTLPHLSFLDYENPDAVVVDKDMLRQMAQQLEKTLSDFGVKGKVVEICPGPVITMFEFSPAAGVKLSKIANLSDDLAMALAAISVRIIAPIPGKGVVGIEVPNPTREMVFLKEIIADEAFQNSRARMSLALGKNTEGAPVVADLAAMPHLLVAGATGAGKSVAVNTMIVSLLFRFTPDEVRLIMVDPKMLEFSIYEGIPHLLLPVVTDPKQAAVALRWAVDEMERRYGLMAEMAVRNITTYNKRVEKLTREGEQDLKAGRYNSAAVKKLHLDADGTPAHQNMPYIVCIIDEFADLMMVASKDVETSVARLAQKARACGIHLILATQRPSVDVITGLIKANFPTRLALRVAQKTDSRTILDSNGAESLLGRGDMLFLPPGSSQQQRVHGAFISEDEIERVVAFLKEQGSPDYNNAILQGESEGAAPGGDDEDGELDEHYDEGVFIVTSERRASISLLQRKLRIGYNRAARMIERMEQEGIVSSSDGSRPREVLAPPPPGC